MAYLDFKAFDVGTLASPIRRIPVSPPLQAIERTAVMLARIDPISSLRDVGFRYRLAEIIFGSSKVNQLADPRLETLRSFGVAVAHDRDDIAQREETQLTKFGFDQNQIDEARNIAERYRRSEASKIIFTA